MSDYFFGLGSGHLSAKAAKAAAAAGATLVNHTDPGCRCGYGCRSDCPANQRHWFAGPNRGQPFDGRLAAHVMEAVRSVATRRDRELLG
jgi:hypothetical protein